MKVMTVPTNTSKKPTTGRNYGFVS